MIPLEAELSSLTAPLTVKLSVEASKLTVVLTVAVEPVPCGTWTWSVVAAKFTTTTPAANIWLTAVPVVGTRA